MQGQRTMARLSSGTVRGVFLGVVLVAAMSTASPAFAQCGGSLSVWGNDDQQQVSGAPEVGGYIAIAAGGQHSVAVRADGSLISWGQNQYGQVSNTPTTGSYVAVAAGYSHSVAIRSDGSLVSWGWNGYGQVSGTPTTGTYTKVACGYLHSVALRSDGTLVSWGYNEDGQVSATPAGTFVAIACGAHHSLAIRTDGSIAAWGWEYLGTVSGTPMTGSYIAVSGAYAYSAAIRSDGGIVLWGATGLGPTPSGAFTAIAASPSYAVALRSDGTLTAWGSASDGIVSGTPTGGGFTAISMRGNHAMALGPSTDTDGDTINDGCDNCPTLASANQTDSDGDGFGNPCDVCDHGPDDVDCNQNTTADACEIAGPPGHSALLFDGADDGVSATTANVGPIFTIEAWVKPDQINGLRRIVSNRSCPGGVALTGNNGKLVLSLFALGTYETAGTYLTPGVWKHVGVVFDPSLNVHFYVNGVLVESMAGSTAPFAGPLGLYVGRNPPCTNAEAFSGEIDEVRIWSVARTPSEMAASTRSVFPTATPGLTAYWRFEENAGATTADGSGNGHTGTLVGGISRAAVTVPGDCDRNFVPDACEPDSDGDGRTNACDACPNDPANDADGDGVCGDIDQCAGFEDTIDCDSNGIPDGCDLNGRSLQFSGGQYAYAYLDLNESASTVSFWFRTSASSGGLFGVSHLQFGLNGHDRNLSIDNGDLVARIYRSSGSETIRTSGVNVSDGEWHQVTHVHGSAIWEQRLYVDGVLRESGAFWSSEFFWQDRFYLGWSGDGATQFFSGDMDEVRIWNTDLSALEIADNAVAGAVPPRPGNLLAWYRFEEAGGTPWVLDSAPLAGINYASLGADTNPAADDPARIGSEIVALDCNSNGTPDGCDLAGNDCNANGEPDECEFDVNDCDTNGVPDDCELAGNDCNTNGVHDACELTGNDCDASGIPDNCEVAANDCNSNGTHDTCELSGQDCNANGTLDECELRGGALQFAGGQYVTAPLNVNEPAGSVSLWFRTNASSGGLFSVSAGALGGSGHDRHIYVSGGNIAARIWRQNVPEETIITSGLNVSDGRWHQVTHVYGPTVGGQRMYVDGILRASGSAAYSEFTWQDRVYVGWSADAVSPYFTGEIDDLRIWDADLDAAEVAANSAFGAAPPRPENLIAWYEFEEAGGSQLVLDSAPLGGSTTGSLGGSAGPSGNDPVRTSFGVVAGNCDANDVLDACELSGNDCNSNGTHDACESGDDCDANGVLDGCESAGSDCNTNGVHDACELAVNDCDQSGTLDDCELAGNDCNSNGLLDSCEVGTYHNDCNTNGVPDDCDIAGGVSLDVRPAAGDGVPDECQPVHNVTQDTWHNRIQAAIDAAVGGDEIVAGPGSYPEAINFRGKAVHLRGSAGAEATSIEASSGYTVTCNSGEGPTTVLDGFTIIGIMLSDWSSPTVQHCTFRPGASRGNLAGAMENYSNSPTLISCTFIGTTSCAGAMYNDGSSMVATNCAFVNNEGFCGVGGAITHYYGSLALINCTFSGNSGSGGSAIYSCGGNVSVGNSIVWGNAPNPLYADCGDVMAVSYSDVQGGHAGVGNIDADPMFVDASGGDLRLAEGSPCIDAGSNGLLPPEVTEDMENSPRVMGDAVDMGAFEHPGETLPGDFDDDGDIDLDDHLAFTDCMAGPGAAPAPPGPNTPQDCLDVFDFDSDLDVDMMDAAELCTTFTGS